MEPLVVHCPTASGYRNSKVYVRINTCGSFLFIRGNIYDRWCCTIHRNICSITVSGKFFRIVFICHLAEPVNPRSMTKETLKDALQAQGARCLALLEPKAAVEEALRRKEDYDVILFAGSLYLIGQIRGMLREAVR